MNTMNNYEYNEGIEFNGLIPKVMEADGVETIGASDFNARLFENGHLGGGSLEVVDFFGTAFGNNGGGDDDKHEYVDLGLPSGTLWATENIKDADGNDLYFAWGETQGYTAEQVGNNDKGFYNEDYKYGTVRADGQNFGMTKYNKTDGKTVLDPEDDAATVNWGGGWRMPTREEFKELTENTTSTFTQVDGVNGMLFTSTANGNTLFFPAVGLAKEGMVHDVGGYGFYWSVSLRGEGVYNAWLLCIIDRGYSGMDYLLRNRGNSVRPVRSQSL